MKPVFNGTVLAALLFVTQVNAAGPNQHCLKVITTALAELQSFNRRVSQADGSEIVNIHVYVRAMEANPRWKRFADEITEARKITAPNLNNRRNAFNQAKMDPDFEGRAPDYGYSRMKSNAARQQGRSIEEAFNRFNPGQDYEVFRLGTKLVISPKNKIIGKTYVEIRYDFSGNYFRMHQGKFTGSKHLKFKSPGETYIDWDGNLIDTSQRLEADKFEELMESSHWNAIRE